MVGCSSYKGNDYDAEKSGFTRHVNVGTEDEMSCPMAKAPPGYTTDWVMQLNLVLPARGQAAASLSVCSANSNLDAASVPSFIAVLRKLNNVDGLSD